jgi:hypothetical protein
MQPPNGDNKALNALFWRDEILQIMYWIQGEHIDNSVSARKLLTLLNTDEENLLHHLKRMVYEEFLEHESENYSMDSTFKLVDQVKKEAGKKFAEAFQGLQKAGHGECGPDCDCQWEGHDSCNHHHIH